MLINQLPTRNFKEVMWLTAKITKSYELECQET